MTENPLSFTTMSCSGCVLSLLVFADGLTSLGVHLARDAGNRVAAQSQTGLDAGDGVGIGRHRRLRRGFDTSAHVLEQLGAGLPGCQQAVVGFVAPDGGPRLIGEPAGSAPDLRRVRRCSRVG